MCKRAQASLQDGNFGYGWFGRVGLVGGSGPLLSTCHGVLDLAAERDRPTFHTNAAAILGPEPGTPLQATVCILKPADH